MQANALISSTIESVHPQEDGNKALEMMDNFRIHHLPITKNNYFLGVVSDKEIMNWDYLIANNTDVTSLGGPQHRFLFENAGYKLQDYTFNYLEEQIKLCPFECTTVFDFFWWLNYSMKWNLCVYRALTKCVLPQPFNIDNWYPFYNAPELHQWSIPIKITFPKYRNDEGTIHIKVSSSRALEIEMKKKIIINNINIMFGYNAINNIRLHHGKLEQKVIKQKKSTQNHENYFDPKQFKINNKKLTVALKKLGMKLN